MTLPSNDAAPGGAIGRRKLKSRPDPWETIGSATVTKDFSRATAALVAFAQAKGFAAIGFQCPDCTLKYATDKALSMHHVHFHQGWDAPHDDAACILDAAARQNPTQTEDIAMAKSVAEMCEGGMNLPVKFPCPHCSQKYDTERALSMHCRWIHPPEGESMNEGYTLSYDFDKSQMDKPAQSGNQPAVAPGDPPGATRPLEARTRGSDTRDPRDPFWRDRFREPSWGEQPKGDTEPKVLSRL